MNKLLSILSQYNGSKESAKEIDDFFAKAVDDLLKERACEYEDCDCEVVVNEILGEQPTEEDYGTRVCIHMNEWRQKYHSKFKNPETFWEMFFTELEDVL